MALFTNIMARASRDSVPVTPALTEILDEYRKSMGNPEVGLVFHSGDWRPICADSIGRRVIRRALGATRLPWYGWHAFRRGLASTCMQWELRTKSCNPSCATRNSTVPGNAIFKVFDRTVLEAVEKVQARIEELRRAKENGQQLELRFATACYRIQLFRVRMIRFRWRALSPARSKPGTALLWPGP